MLNPSTRIFDGTSRLTLVRSVGINAAANAIAVSSSGKLIAVGCDAGYVEIWEYDPVQHDRKRIRLFGVVGEVRAIVWHPQDDRVFFVGCELGNLYGITLVAPDIDIICSGAVDGYIHALGIDETGSRLAVAHGAFVGVVDHPFDAGPDRLGELMRLKETFMSTSNDPRDSPVIRCLHFLDDRTLLVAASGSKGIRAFSIDDGSKAWSMRVQRDGNSVGSAAVSPSGERVAIANLRNGIDWYSVSHKSYAMTTKFKNTTNRGGNYVVGIVFIDEDTVAVGHIDGKVIFASCGIPFMTGHLRVAEPNQAVQTLAFAFSQNQALIIASSNTPLESDKRSAISVIRILPTAGFPTKKEMTPFGFWKSGRAWAPFVSAVAVIFCAAILRPAPTNQLSPTPAATIIQTTTVTHTEPWGYLQTAIGEATKTITITHKEIQHDTACIFTLTGVHETAWTGPKACAASAEDK